MTDDSVACAVHMIEVAILAITIVPGIFIFVLVLHSIHSIKNRYQYVYKYKSFVLIHGGGGKELKQRATKKFDTEKEVVTVTETSGD